jgi:hypothetical protein
MYMYIDSYTDIMATQPLLTLLALHTCTDRAEMAYINPPETSFRS